MKKISLKTGTVKLFHGMVPAGSGQMIPGRGIEVMCHQPTGNTCPPQTGCTGTECSTTCLMECGTFTTATPTIGEDGDPVC